MRKLAATKTWKLFFDVLLSSKGYFICIIPLNTINVLVGMGNISEISINTIYGLLFQINNNGSFK